MAEPEFSRPLVCPLNQKNGDGAGNKAGQFVAWLAVFAAVIVGVVKNQTDRDKAQTDMLNMQMKSQTLYFTAVVQGLKEVEAERARSMWKSIDETNMQLLRVRDWKDILEGDFPAEVTRSTEVDLAQQTWIDFLLDQHRCPPLNTAAP